MNLTTMLVMTTIFISKMEGLPPTSDIKMIDIWLVLCQMVPFVEVILLTAMEYNREDEEKETKRKNKRRRKKQKEGSASSSVLTVEPMEYHTKDQNGDEEEETNISTETHWCTIRRLKQWLPRLKTIGNLTYDTFSVVVEC